MCMLEQSGLNSVSDPNSLGHVAERVMASAERLSSEHEGEDAVKEVRE